MFVEKRMEAQKTHKTCAIYKCGNRMAPIFRFPHPKRGLDRFMAWVKASNNPKFEGLTNDQIYRRGYICYQHFRAEDYVQGTQRLHQSAVPTILPPRGKNKLKVTTKQILRHVYLQMILYLHHHWRQVKLMRPL